MTRLALIAALLSCGTLAPEERGIEVDYGIHKVYNQDKALLMFERMAEDATGNRYGNAWEDAQIWWTTTTCPYGDFRAVVYRGECSFGRMWSCGEIYVSMPVNERTCNSALIHEHAHCLSLTSEGHADSDHTGPLWDTVLEANQIACERGW